MDPSETSRTLAFVSRAAVNTLAARIFGAAVGLGSHVLLARALRVEEYGVLLVVLAWVNLMVLAAKSGFDTALVRYVAAYRAQEQWGSLRGLLRRSLQIVAGVALGVGVLGAGVSWLFGSRIPPAYPMTILVGTLAVPVLALTGLLQATLRGLKHVVQSELIDRTIRMLFLMAFVGAAWALVPGGLAASEAMGLMVIAALCSLGLGGRWVGRSLPPQVRASVPVYATRDWFRTALPLLLVSGMSVVLSQSDVIMVGWLTDANTAGMYGAASRLATLATFGLLASNAILAPTISDYHSRGKLAEMKIVTQRVTRGVFLFSVAAGVALVALGRPLLGLFGPEFEGALLPLAVLVGGYLISSFIGPVGFLMTMTGRQSGAAWILSTWAILNVLLNAVLIPPFGMTGASVATALCIAGWNLSMLVSVQRSLHMRPSVL